MDKFILYHSHKCKYCGVLIKEIEDNNLGDKFNSINVHISDVPSNVTNVPTVLIDRNTKLEGKEIFAWLKKLIPQNQGIVPIESNQMTDPYTFINNHNGNIHKGFEYIDDNVQNTANVNVNGRQQNQQQSNKGIDMDRLVQARKNDIPQPVRRI